MMKAGRGQPYLFQHFNISGYYNSTIGISNVIKRLMNAFVDELNENNLLPKYLLIIPDKDLLAGLQDKNGISIIIGAILHHIIKQINIFIERRKVDLRDKKPGGMLDDEFPKIVWIRMVKRPKLSNHLYSLRSKFNVILEDRLQDGNADNHFIMSIDVNLNEFDLTGGLTKSGCKQFWHEVNQGMKKFTENDITLMPRQIAKKKAEAKAKDVPALKLPTPPRETKHRHHSPCR